jgi:DNA-binding MarR family transcriptional regulator
MMDERLYTRMLELRMMTHLLWKASSQAMDQWLLEQGMDITRLQMGVLRMLEHHGPQTISELSRKFGLDASTLVPTVDALERKGWVIRERDPNDRRRVPLTLTEAGHSIMGSIPSVVEGDPLVFAMREMDDEHVTQIITYLHELVMHLPDGEQMLKDFQARLVANGAKEQYLICKQ